MHGRIMNDDTYISKSLLEGLFRPVAPWIPLGATLALVTLGRFETLDGFLAAALERGVPAAHLEETLLQAHLFAGFPRAIRALKIFRRIIEERRETRTPPPRPRRFRPRFSSRRRRGRGRRIFDAVYGSIARAVLHALDTLHPGYGGWVLEDAYGRVLARPGLPPLWRELCAVAALAVTDVPEQLYSHVRGALRMGASPQEVEEAIRAIGPLVPPKKIDHALEILSKMDVN